MIRTLEAKKRFCRQGRLTERAAAVMRMFGVDLARLEQSCPDYRCRFELAEGEICYITGPSGSGKSVLLRALAESLPPTERLDLSWLRLPADRPVVDCLRQDLLAALRTLSSVGLGDVFCVLNTPAALSDGQKYRYRLAKAIDYASRDAARRRHRTGAKVIFADEFCSTLDRITATAVAFNVRKLATKLAISFILAGSHDDILADLAPDVLVITQLCGGCELVYRDAARRQKTKEQK